jgi:hypothetical protein
VLEELPNEIPNLRTALRVLSALIAPAILILACASLVGVVSNMLSAVVERTRHIAGNVSDHGDSGVELAFLLEDLSRAMQRSRLLQRALSSLLVAIAVLVVSSVLFAVVAVWLPHSAWIPVLFAVIGVGFLLYACVILALDSRIGITAVDKEMSLIRRTHTERAKAPGGQPDDGRSRRLPSFVRQNY